MTDRNKGSLSQVGMACLIHVIQFAGADNNYGNESDEKHQRSQYAEEVHSLMPKVERNQREIKSR